MPFNLEKEQRFKTKLVPVYNLLSEDSKSKVTMQEFIGAFPIVENADKGVEPDRPEDFEIDEGIFAKVIEAFNEVYRKR